MKSRRLIHLCVVALAGSVILSGCTSRLAIRHPGTASHIKLGPKDIELTRVGEGKDCAPAFLGLQFSAPSYQEAQQAALKSASAELLLDEITYDGVQGIYLPNPYAVLIPGMPPAIVIIGQTCGYVEGYGANRK